MLINYLNWRNMLKYYIIERLSIAKNCSMQLQGGIINYVKRLPCITLL